MKSLPITPTTFHFDQSSDHFYVCALFTATHLPRIVHRKSSRDQNSPQTATCRESCAENILRLDKRGSLLSIKHDMSWVVGRRLFSISIISKILLFVGHWLILN